MRAPRRLREVPLSLEVVDGWRAWSVVEEGGELRLSSLTRAERWEPAEPFVASCLRRGHAPPGRACSCGVYAAVEPEELAGLGKIAGAAIGQVSLWGRIAEHRRGYRAAIAYPARLRLVCVVCLGEGVGVPATRLDHDPSAPERLFPLCGTHAAGRVLPPAGPFETRLLSTYQVELVPDRSIGRIRNDRVGERAKRRGRRRVSAIAVALLTLLVAVAVVRDRGPGGQVPKPTASTSVFHAAPGPEPQGGVPLPFDRATNGLISSPRIRVLLLTPKQFGAPRCGRLTASDVVPAECADPRADVFVEDVGPAGADREGTCSDATAFTTRKGDRLLCWRLLPQR
ncbi:MAG: hypothetical protein ABJB55_01815 [Actinomycetota bacterium]